MSKKTFTTKSTKVYGHGVPCPYSEPFVSFVCFVARSDFFTEHKNFSGERLVNIGSKNRSKVA
jgi:hypothetical protein